MKELNHTIAVEVAAHPYAGLFAPMPRIGGLNLAQVVGGVGLILERAENAVQVAAEVGVAPVTHESGTRRSVVFRMAVNHHARQAMTVFADNSRHADAWAASLYANAGPRQATPACDPDPRQSLGPGDVAMLEDQHPLRPDETTPGDTSRIGGRRHCPPGHALRAAPGRRRRAASGAVCTPRGSRLSAATSVGSDEQPSFTT